MSLTEAFFRPDGGDFIASELTRGPWSPDHQHGGPGVALMGRAIARRAAAELGAVHVARITVELLRPIPIGRCSVAASVVRSGRKVQELTASLHVDGREVARATALTLRTPPVALPAPAAAGALRPPHQSEPFRLPFFTAPVSYHDGIELRAARGAFGAGALAAWIRMRVPLVAGEPPSPLERVLVAADSGNGVSAVLDAARYTFINPDLTVCLHRMPEGEWVCLDAATTPEPTGVGLADSALHDTRGPIGRATQCLLIEERGA